MNQAFGFLSCLWQDFDESKVDIIASLPFELAVIILRLLDPSTLVATILVSRRWLRLIRSDVLLRRRVYDELRRERRVYRAMIEGRSNDKLSVEFLKRLMQRCRTPARKEFKPRTLRPEPAKSSKETVHRMPLEQLPAPLATSTPKIGLLPSKVGKIRPKGRDVLQRPIPMRSKCIRL